MFFFSIHSLVPLQRRGSHRSGSITSTIRQSLVDETSVNDTLDSTLGRLALSGGRERKGNSVDTVGQLRRPKLEKRNDK